MNCKLPVVILLAASLLLGGCGTAKVAKTTAPATLIPTAKPIDMGGRVVNIFDFTVLEQTRMMDYDETVMESYQEARIAQIEKTYNCKLHFLSADEVLLSNSSGQKDNNKFLKSLKTSNPEADILCMRPYEAYNALSSNSDYPLLSLKPYLGILNIEDQTRWKTKDIKDMAANGDVRVVINNAYYNNFFYNNVMFFNKSLMERKGLWSKYNLFDLQKNKQWNWNVFSTLCKKVSDGTVKGFAFDYDSLDYLLMSNSNGDGKNMAAYYDTKNIVALDKPIQKQTIDLLSNLNANHALLVGNKYGKEGDNEFLDDYDNGQAILHGKVLFVIAPGSTIFNLGQAQDEWGAVALPMGPNSKNYIIDSDRGYHTNTYGIIKSAHQPEQLAYILHDLASPLLPNDQAVSLIADQMRQNMMLPTTGEGTAQTYRLLSNPDLFYPALNYLHSDYSVYLYLTHVFNNQYTLDSFYTKELPAWQEEMTKRSG